MKKRMDPEFEDELRNKVGQFGKSIQRNHAKRVESFYDRIKSIKEGKERIDNYLRSLAKKK